MREQPGHGLDEYLALLNAIPKEVNVAVGGAGDGTSPASDVDFDRRVRAALDRLHRRQQIAEN